MPLASFQGILDCGAQSFLPQQCPLGHGRWSLEKRIAIVNSVLQASWAYAGHGFGRLPGALAGVLHEQGGAMKFSVGDKVMYLHRGAGIITGIEHKELVDGFEHYYVIEIESQRLTLRVPMRMAEELGVRRVMLADKLDEVWSALKGRPRPLADDFKERQEQIRAKLRSGNPVKVAQAVRDLNWREQQSYLTKADAELLAQGLDFLIAEIAAVMDKEIAEVEPMVNVALSRRVVA